MMGSRSRMTVDSRANANGPGLTGSYTNQEPASLFSRRIKDRSHAVESLTILFTRQELIMRGLGAFGFEFGRSCCYIFVVTRISEFW